VELDFAQEFQEFKKLMQDDTRFSMKWEDCWPCLNDKTATTAFDRHYIYHTAWAARVLTDINPVFHVDISSSLYFVAIASAFVPIKFYDYRPVNLSLKNLSAGEANLSALPFANKSIASLSCMHVVEHIGLGRYGDPLDPEGDLKAIAELTRVLAVGGHLLFVVPIGKPRIVFNAHRIYSYDQIIEYFADLKLVEFALIPDDPTVQGLVSEAPREMANIQNYGCGCFWFRRVE